MNGDIGAMLESVLSDPEQMKKITEMARGLMGDSRDPGEQGGETRPPKDPANPGVDPGMLSMLGGMFGGKQPQTRSTALLMAMRPYMRPEKQEKLDRAMKIARIVHIASAVMKEYWGGPSGI